jgi:SEC-C motif-containing protein
MSVCPCRSLEESKLSYEQCCAPFVEGIKKVSTAEQLMRSRYSAYVVKNIGHIDQTQISLENEVFNKEEALKWAESSEWKGLEIRKTQKGGPSDQTGTVEFIAHYQDKASGAELRHHETSLFNKHNGEWKFKEGQIHGAEPLRRLGPKVGRNDPCNCGSGRKFKKCCGV